MTATVPSYAGGPGAGAAAAGLSLCMIVRNEEQFLPGCLESIRGLVDEIVVVDTGSTDRTMAIAGGAGARVIEAPWKGDFSQARNLALAQCTGAWVLYLDADERLAAGQHDRLCRLLADDRAAAYTVVVRSVLSLENGTGTQVMPYPRLFRRKPGVRFEGAVHEQIAPSIQRTGGRILPSSLVIEHLGYNQGFSVLKAKVQRNLAPLLKRLEQDPDDWQAHLHVARSLLLVGDHPAVVHHARAALRVLGIPRPFVAVLNNLLAETMFRMRRWSEVIACCRRSLALVPHQAGANWFLAGAYVHSKDLRAAASALEELTLFQVAGSGSGAPQFADDIVLPEEVVWEMLGRCYAGMGLQERAVEALFKAVRANPSAADIAARFWETLEHLGRPAYAERHCEALAPLMPHDPRPLLYLALSRRQQGDLAGGLALLERVLQAQPGDPSALSWKALWALERKDYQAVEQVLGEAGTRGIVTPDLLRCALEVSVQRGRYQEALLRLQPLAAVFTPEQYQKLHQKISALAAAGVP